MVYLSKRRIFGLLFLAGFVVVGWTSRQEIQAASSEYNFFNTSPAGTEGGLAVPASCDSRTVHSQICWWVPDAGENGGHQACSNDDGDPSGWNGVDTPCPSPGNNCGDTNSGLTQCDGSCSASAPADRGYVGQSCQSLANNCGEQNTGGFLCNGNCDAPIPDWVPLGDPCQSSGTNSCGMRGDGQITCTGCNATVPPDTACGSPCGDGYCNGGIGETCSSCQADCGACALCTNGSFCNGVDDTSEAGFPNNHTIQDQCNCGDPGSGWVQVGGPAGTCYHRDTGASCGTCTNDCSLGASDVCAGTSFTGNCGQSCNGTKDCSTCSSQSGACGTAATAYTSGASNFSGALCNIGNSSPASPSFPAAGSSVNWTCSGVCGGPPSGTCTASRAGACTPQAGACGTAAKSYLANASSFSGSMCSVGSPSPANPAFPARGNSVNWTCSGVCGGSPSESCTAYHAPVGTDICTGSTPAHATIWPGDEPPSNNLAKQYSATNTSRLCEFYCDSPYTWNGTSCVLPTVNGSCGTTVNACGTGTWTDRTDTATTYEWSCIGSGAGHTDALTCSIAKSGITNGSCGTGTNTCNAGTWADRADTYPYYYWSCIGSGVGHSDALDCSFRYTYCGSAHRVAVPEASPPTANLCDPAATPSVPVAGASAFTWTCTFGGTVSSCNADFIVPVSENGECGYFTNTCNSGTFEDRTDTATSYEWSCLGSAGHTSALDCSFPNIPAPVCAGPAPTEQKYYSLTGRFDMTQWPVWGGDTYNEIYADGSDPGGMAVHAGLFDFGETRTSAPPLPVFTTAPYGCVRDLDSVCNRGFCTLSYSGPTWGIVPTASVPKLPTVAITVPDHDKMYGNSEISSAFARGTVLNSTGLIWQFEWSAREWPAGAFLPVSSSFMVDPWNEKSFKFDIELYGNMSDTYFGDYFGPGRHEFQVGHTYELRFRARDSAGWSAPAYRIVSFMGSSVVSKVRVCPDSQNAFVNETKQFNAWAINNPALPFPPDFCDRSDTDKVAYGAYDVTATAIWSHSGSGNPAARAVAGTPGAYLALAPGSITVTANQGGYADSALLNVDLNTLKLCWNDCSNARVDGETITIRDTESRNYVACYNNSTATTDCGGGPSVVAVWNESSSPDNAVTLSGSDPKTVSGIILPTEGTRTESVSATHNGQTANITFNVYKDCGGTICNAAIQENTCQNELFDGVDGCGNPVVNGCSGSRSCDFNWKEVAP